MAIIRDLTKLDYGKINKNKFKIIVKNKYLYFMLLPVMLWYIIFNYIPMYGVVLAFKTYVSGSLKDFLIGGKWVGLEYFKELFESDLFFRALKNTMIISSYKILFLFPLTIVLALMLNEVRNVKFKKIVQTVAYLPYFFSWVIVGTIVIQLFTSQGGIISQIYSFFNDGQAKNLLLDKNNFRTILVASNGIKGIGFGTIIYLAAIAGVSSEIYEACEIDGGNRFQKIWYITLPSISNTMVIMLLLTISFMISGDFEQVLMLYTPTVYETGDILDTYIYRLALKQGDFSFATAVGLFKSFVSLALLVSSNIISKRIFGQSIFGSED